MTRSMIAMIAMIASLVLSLLGACRTGAPSPAVPAAPAPAAAPAVSFTDVRGWTLLSDSEEDAMAVIARAKDYGINQLQISHELVMDLREMREADKRARVLRLVKAAKAAGIGEVLVWDHALYALSYYPQQYRTGPDGSIDLDDPAFWTWFKQDYREMLDLLPGIDGIVLTFIETGARAERQHSNTMTTPSQKLASVLNAVADVVVGERKLRLYPRTFSYTFAEYEVVLGAVRLIQRPEVRLLIKETPHDFFLTHPNDLHAGSIARPTIIEFDAGGEFNGQGQIANTFPEVFLDRWAELQKRPHVIGYVARVDRYGRSRIVGRSTEILLHALKRKTEDPAVTADRVYDEFIGARYGAAAVAPLKPAFQAARDIVTSTLYTLGTNTANHSELNYDPYASSYGRHVSGKWLDPPVARVAHGVDKQLHYWTDVIDHLAPARFKTADGPLKVEAPWVLEKKWVEPEEKMDEAFLGYVVAEKAFGVSRAEQALKQVEGARAVLKPADHEDLHALFERTLLTARLHRAVASAYFGYRVWARGGGFRTPAVVATVKRGLEEIPAVAAAIKAHRGPIYPGAWRWERDAERALALREKIAVSGWKEYGGAPFAP
jgi:hypothetical protein